MGGAQQGMGGGAKRDDDLMKNAPTTRATVPASPHFAASFRLWNTLAKSVHAAPCTDFFDCCLGEKLEEDRHGKEQRPW